MSFWNKDNYKVRVVDFVERFVAHNTVIKLYTEHYFLNEEGMPVHDYIQIWKGMDWQITEGYINSDYFKVHPDVLPCPYSYGEANVVKTKNIGHVAACSDEVSLIINEIPWETIKKPEAESYKPNTAVCNSDGEIKYSC